MFIQGSHTVKWQSWNVSRALGCCFILAPLRWLTQEALLSKCHGLGKAGRLLLSAGFRSWN